MEPVEFGLGIRGAAHRNNRDVDVESERRADGALVVHEPGLSVGVGFAQRDRKRHRGRLGILAVARAFPVEHREPASGGRPVAIHRRDDRDVAVRHRFTDGERELAVVAGATDLNVLPVPGRPRDPLAQERRDERGRGRRVALAVTQEQDLKLGARQSGPRLCYEALLLAVEPDFAELELVEEDLQ